METVKRNKKSVALTAQQKIEKKGYKVTYTMEGNVMAFKGQQTYKAKNITQLYKKIS